LTQTQSVLPTSVTPSNTQTTPPPSIVPPQGVILATNLDHDSPSLNDPSVATEANISPFNTYTVSPVMDPLTLEMNMVNEHAKASAAATGEVRVDPARYRKYITGTDRRSVVTRIFYAIKEV
jgi:hypothetical protein